jgi:hypothetical protein
MDAKSFNGPDERDEFGLDPDDERCEVCGASEDEPCTWNCTCGYCIRKRDREKVSA